MKVLIVDDHAVVRHGLKSAITSHGYEVVAEAGSINEAQAFMIMSELPKVPEQTPSLLRVPLYRI